MFKRHSYLNLVWTDDQITVFHHGKEDHFVHVDNIQDTVDSILEKIHGKIHSVKVFYEGHHIEQHVEDCPNIKSKRDIEELIKHKIHTGKIHGVADIDHVYSSYQIGRSTTGQLLLVNIIQKSFVDDIKCAFKKHGVAVDMITSMTPAMAAVAKTIDCSGNLILLTGMDYNQTNSVLYYDGKNKECYNTRVANAYRDVKDMQAEVENSSLFGMQLFEGEKLPIYGFGKCSSELDEFIKDNDLDIDFHQLDSDNILANTIQRIDINHTANFIPEGERGLRTKRRSAVVVSMVALLAFTCVSSFVYIKHQERIRLSVNKEINTELIQLKATKEDQLNKLQNKIAIAENILHGQSDNPYLAVMNISVIKENSIHLTHLKGQARKGFIELTIEGLAFGGLTQAKESLKALSQSLRAVGITITHDWKEHWLMDTAKWQQTNSNGRDTGIPFRIEGVAKHVED